MSACMYLVHPRGINDEVRGNLLDRLLDPLHFMPRPRGDGAGPTEVDLGPPVGAPRGMGTEVIKVNLGSSLTAPSGVGTGPAEADLDPPLGAAVGSLRPSVLPAAGTVPAKADMGPLLGAAREAGLLGSG